VAGGLPVPEPLDEGPIPPLPPEPPDLARRLPPPSHHRYVAIGGHIGQQARWAFGVSTIGNRS